MSSAAVGNQKSCSVIHVPTHRGGPARGGRHTGEGSRGCMKLHSQASGQILGVLGTCFQFLPLTRHEYEHSSAAASRLSRHLVWATLRMRLSETLAAAYQASPPTGHIGARLHGGSLLPPGPLQAGGPFSFTTPARSSATIEMASGKSFRRARVRVQGAHTGTSTRRASGQGGLPPPPPCSCCSCILHRSPLSAKPRPPSPASSASHPNVLGCSSLPALYLPPPRAVYLGTWTIFTCQAARTLAPPCSCQDTDDETRRSTSSYSTDERRRHCTPPGTADHSTPCLACAMDGTAQTPRARPRTQPPPSPGLSP
jgi:hypothetical protein